MMWSVFTACSQRSAACLARSLETRRALPALAATLGLALTLLATLAGCAPQSRAPAPTATPTTQARLAALVRRAIGGGAQSIETTFDAQSQVVKVMATVGGNVPRTDAQISAAQQRVKRLCFQAQQAIWTSGLAAREATVTLLGPALDDYANIVIQPYGTATLTSAQAQTFDWRTLNAADAWQRYDQVWLRPTYAPNQRYGAPTASATA